VPRIPPSRAPDGLVSTEAIRARFPALERTQAAHPVAYFDGPGGTQVPATVAEAVSTYLLEHNANAHWAFPTSAETDRVLENARGAMADFLGGRADEIAFGANMTTLTFHLARAVGRRFAPGDEVVVTELDHHANVDPWYDMARARGLRVRAVPFRIEDGELDWEALEAMIGPRTRLVALGVASNALGTVNDVARATRLARDAGALSFVDAVHSAAHLPTDVSELGCDFLVCSAYKFYGPHVGVLWGRRELLEDLDVPKLRPAPEEAPCRMETGTLNHEGIAGTTAAVEFLASLVGADESAETSGSGRRERLRAAMGGLHDRGTSLVQRLWDGLAGIPGVRMYGPPPGRPRTPTVSFTLRGIASRDVAAALAESHALFCSHGDFYATTVAERLGVSGRGMVRAGCACYTTSEEVDRLLEGVTSLAGRA
jgi:cysteine desulfurase family protein (TIGR01976 family)